MGEQLEECLQLKDEFLPMLYTKKVFQQEFPFPEKIEMIMSKKLIVNSTVRRDRDYEFIRLIYIIQIEIQNQKCHTWQPRSPSPKIRSPSVTTITWIDFSGQFFKTSRIFPLKDDNHSLFGSMLYRRLWKHKCLQKVYFSFKLM